MKPIKLPRGVKIHEANEIDYGFPAWIKDTLIERAESRLPFVDRLDEPGHFRVRGNVALGDEFEAYLVRRVGWRWECECGQHNFGRSRKGKCSHIVACRIVDAHPVTRWTGCKTQEPVSVKFLTEDEVKARIGQVKFIEAPPLPSVKILSMPEVKVRLVDPSELADSGPVQDELELEEALPAYGGLAELEQSEEPWLQLARLALHGDNFEPAAFDNEPSSQNTPSVGAGNVVQEAPRARVSAANERSEPALAAGASLDEVRQRSEDFEEPEPDPDYLPPPVPLPVSSLYLPPWCRELRPHQVFAIERACAAFASGKRNVIMEGPVGMGKTLVATLIAQALGVRSNYICTDKALQRQYKGDYPDAEMLMGRANYTPCDAPRMTCGDCNYKKGKGCTLCRPETNFAGVVIPMSSKWRCPYVQAKKQAQRANQSILNTDYFLAACNFHAAGQDNVAGFWGFNSGQETFGFGRRGLSIYDEAHKLEAALMGFTEVQIGPKMLEFFQATPPLKRSRWSTRISWLAALQEKIMGFVSAIVGARYDLEEEDDDEDEETKFLKSCIQCAYKISCLLTDLEGLESDPEERRESWVYECTENSVSFKPVRVAKYGKTLLFGHSRLNFLMTGTVIMPEPFAADIGLRWEETEFIQIDSVFPKERRPVLVRPVASMFYRQKGPSTIRMQQAVLDIRQEYPGKMLVHTVSYELNKAIGDHLRANGLRPYTHWKGGPTADEALALYRRGGPDSILLSPAMECGVDLKHDDCRLCLIAKIPFPSLGDDQVSRRMWQPTKMDGELWYKRQALARLLQMAGRGMRSYDDWCRIFILDEQFLKLYREMKRYLTPGFTDSIVFDMRTDPILKLGIPEGLLKVK